MKANDLLTYIADSIRRVQLESGHDPVVDRVARSIADDLESLGALESPAAFLRACGVRDP